MNNADTAVENYDARHFSDEAKAEREEEERFERVGERSLEMLTDPNEVETLLEALTESTDFRVMFCSMIEEYIKEGPWQHKAHEVCTIAVARADFLADQECE